MKKTLVEVHNLEEHICGKCFYQDGTKILTSGAKDALLKRGIRIEFCEKPVTQCSETACASAESLECLTLKIGAFLQESYGIQDMALLHKISSETAAMLHNK